ncbi:MAG: YggS family pyridoxal phosphate-dependent enzyme [Ruminococcaceae bacterium]|nr:YggS family pyridoxal phosphate-dependent enzyme [Oscillospiraceae bacterium]
MSIADNLARVQENIARACARSGRSVDDITLLPVTKTRSVEEIREVMAAGYTALGENRVQELMEKYDALAGAQWHLIGHLQTNKIKYIVDKVSLIHSVDSLHLAEQINAEAAKRGVSANVLLEVNISGEESKYGMQAGDIDRILDAAEEFSNLKVKGLMTMAPIWANEYEIRTVFSKLYQIYIDISTKKYNNSNMEYLSMGMSNDYEIAAEEGANVLRVGRAVFAAE